jgi:2-methylcitrate dehydratase PrpD
MTNQAAASVTTGLATYVAAAEFASFPSFSVERAKDLLLDHLGVALYGASMPWSEMVRSSVLAEEGRAESTIYGWGRVPARGAALVNATAAHAVELDDTHDEALQHPGCVIWPAALAISESLDRSGADMLAAVIAAYDVECRIGAAVGKHLYAKGFHPTSSCGVFGACAAAGRLMGLNAVQLVSAFGSAASMACGLMQFTQDPAGTMIKRLHAGMPASSGVLAAQLAFRGFTGPKDSIEGKYGFAHVFVGECDLSRIDEQLGAKFEIDCISVKLYSCCKLFHSLIEAIEQCRDQHPFAPSELVSIVPFGPKAMLEGHMEYRPSSTMSAQYSLPYTVAACIALDAAAVSSYEPEAASRPNVLSICDLVAPRVDDALESRYPQKLAAGVVIRLRDGTELTATVIDSRSSPDRVLPREDILRKFRSLTDGLLTSSKQTQIADLVFDLDNVPSVRRLSEILQGVNLAFR